MYHAVTELHAAFHTRNSAVAMTNRATHYSANAMARLNTPPHICYHAEFGCSRSNRVRTSSGEPAKLGSAGATPFGMEGVADRLKTNASGIRVTKSNLVVFL